MQMRAFLEMKGNRPNVSATASHTKHKGVVPLRYAPFMEPFRASGAGSMTPQRRKNGVPKGSRPGRDVVGMLRYRPAGLQRQRETADPFRPFSTTAQGKPGRNSQRPFVAP